MKSKILLTALAILMFLSSAASAGFKLVKDTLSNGMNVYVLEDRNYQLVTIQIWISAGSVNEDYKTRGATHFLEHLLFKGTSKRKEGDIERELDSLGAHNNAFTSNDYTYFTVTGASCHFDRMLDVESDVIRNSIIANEAVERERKVVIEEIKMGEDIPFKVMNSAVSKNLFDNLPYAFPVIGYQKIIESISRDEIYKYYKDNYQPQNMFVLIVGNVRPEKAIARVNTAFGSFAPSGAAVVNNLKMPPEEPVKKPIYEELRMDVEKCYLHLAFRGVPLASPDQAALDVLASILGYGDSSRLVRVLKDRHKAVDTVAAGSRNMRSAGMFYVALTLDEKNIDKALKLCSIELDSIRNGEFSDAELIIAKKQMEMAYVFNQQSYEQAAGYIGEFISFDGTAKYCSYVDDVKKVTRKDIVGAARKYLHSDAYSLVVVKPLKKNGGMGSGKNGK